MCDAYYMNDGSDCPGKDLEIGGANGTVRETGFVDETNQETIRNWVNIVLAFLYNMCSVNHDSMLQSLIMDQPGSC